MANMTDHQLEELMDLLRRGVRALERLSTAVPETELDIPLPVESVKELDTGSGQPQGSHYEYAGVGDSLGRKL